MHTFLLSALTSIHLEQALYFRHLHHAQLPEQGYPYRQVDRNLFAYVSLFTNRVYSFSDGDLNGKTVTVFVVFDSPDNVNNPVPTVWQYVLSHVL